MRTNENCEGPYYRYKLPKNPFNLTLIPLNHLQNIRKTDENSQITIIKYFSTKKKQPIQTLIISTREQ